jgi:hypothetical protein
VYKISRIWVDVLMFYVLYLQSCICPEAISRFDILCKALSRQFYILKVIEAESQAVLNTFIENDFQDTFKRWQKPGNGAYERKGTTSRVIMASRPKVSF